jgi:hypothetical protein
MSSRRAALRAQALYYAVTGLWPLLHYDSFERITGRKSERWLVETTGGLITTAGIGLALGSRREPPGPETTALAAGSALTLGGIDLVYLVRGRLKWVYGIDMAAQAGLLAAGLRAPRAER